jgi:hypothetical protein
MVGETTTRRPRRILKHGEAISRIPYDCRFPVGV